MGVAGSAVTPEADYLRRREFLRVFGLGLAATALLPPAVAQRATGFPDSLNPTFKLDGVKLARMTSSQATTISTNGGSRKRSPRLSNKGWKTEPWTIEIGGLCSKPGKYDVNDLSKSWVASSNAIIAIAVSRRGPWSFRGTAFHRRGCGSDRTEVRSQYVQFTTFFDPASVPDSAQRVFPGLIRRASPSPRPITNWPSWRPAS